MQNPFSYLQYLILLIKIQSSWHWGDRSSTLSTSEKKRWTINFISKPHSTNWSLTPSSFMGSHKAIQLILYITEFEKKLKIPSRCAPNICLLTVAHRPWLIITKPFLQWELDARRDVWGTGASAKSRHVPNCQREPRRGHKHLTTFFPCSSINIYCYQSVSRNIVSMGPQKSQLQKGVAQPAALQNRHCKPLYLCS